MPKRPATVRARSLGAELRELRNKAGLSTQAVAQQLGWSASTLNRIENGRRNITSEDVSALLCFMRSQAKNEIDCWNLLGKLTNQAGGKDPLLGCQHSSPPKYVTILDEAVLRRPVGGRRSASNSSAATAHHHS